MQWPLWLLPGAGSLGVLPCCGLVPGRQLPSSPTSVGSTARTADLPEAGERGVPSDNLECAYVQTHAGWGWGWRREQDVC